MRFPLLILLPACLVATPAAAQDGYLFGMPRVSGTFRLGVAVPAANDELFRFFTENLTLDRSDFASVAVGGDLAVRVLPRIDLVAGFSSANSSSGSEFRDFVESNDEPIRQTTRLSRSMLTAGIRAHLLPRGRSLSRYAFVPRRFSPYVGAGAGALWYKLEQEGDFVDYETLDIFTDYFESHGRSFTWHVLAGGDYWIIPRVGLNIETRYNWAKADLYDSFADFEEVDLRGWQLTAGVSLRN